MEAVPPDHGRPHRRPVLSIQPRCPFGQRRSRVRIALGHQLERRRWRPRSRPLDPASHPASPPPSNRNQAPACRQDDATGFQEIAYALIPWLSVDVKLIVGGDIEGTERLSVLRRPFL